MSIQCFLNGSVGFRTLANIFGTLQRWVVSLGNPAYTSIRQWLCKFGLYKLNQPKNINSKYYHIIDTSVQMGLQKFVVVLGVKQQDLRENFSPTFEQVEVLVVRPLESCKGEAIRDILKVAAVKTGVPIGIISDEGSELKRGTRLFKEDVKHAEEERSDNDEKIVEAVVHLCDCSHKLNNFLKKDLEDDEKWEDFKKASTDAIQHLKLSPIAHLAPPRQRAKARMHSCFPLIEWGLSLSNYLKSDEAKKLPIEQVSKISWVVHYELYLIECKILMEICKNALDLVHRKGYYRWIAYDFVKSIDNYCYINERCMKFHKKVETFLSEEGGKVPDGQHYLGSSEVIESLFGKFKQMEDHHSGAGLTSLVLAVPALTGKIDESEIYDAMNAVSTKDLMEWLKDNMGQTYLSKRRQDLKPYNKYADALSKGKLGKICDLDPCENIEAISA
jgi:hypothetical protein